MKDPEFVAAYDVAKATHTHLRIRFEPEKPGQGPRANSSSIGAGEPDNYLH